MRFFSRRVGRGRMEIIPKQLQGEFQMVIEMRQHSPARQKSGYFGVIAIILIVATGLCWGFAHS
jgi:hypothetical protein